MLTDAKPTGLAAWQADVARQKRGALLDSAVERFLAKGFDRTSLEDVAQGAGVSSATLYKHFPTKAALFGGVMARLWENDRDAPPPMPPAGDPEAGLLAIGRAYATLLSERRTVDLFRIVITEAPRFPEIGMELYQRGKKPYLDRLHAYLEAEQSAGTIAIDDIPVATRQFVGMINDVVFWPRLLVVDLDLSGAEIDEIVLQAVRTTVTRYQQR